jgi:2'-5' RNA ligase
MKNIQLDVIRSFISIPCPKAVADLLKFELTRIKNRIPPQIIRWTPVEQWHLTLVFFGDVFASELEKIQSALTEACKGQKSFELKLGDFGAFPDWKKPKVLWIGLNGEIPKLLQLQTNIASAVHNWIQKPEGRPFQAHLTVGRIKNVPDPGTCQKIQQRFSEINLKSSQPWIVSEVRLMKSILSPAGAEHFVLYSVNLS